MSLPLIPRRNVVFGLTALGLAGCTHPSRLSALRQTVTVAGRAISTLIASSGIGDMYRIYLTTRRDGVGYRLAYIGPDFTEPYSGPFDRGYMTKLFEHGRRKARVGYPWQTRPPGFIA